VNRRKDVTIVELNIQSDHVYLLGRIPPKISVSDVWIL